MSQEKYQKVVVTGVLIAEDKVLLVRRSQRETFMPGKYECPGGKVDFGEDPRLSLKREYMEETGLDVEVGELLDVIHYVSENGQRHTVEIFFKVQLVDPNSFEVILSEDHDDFMLASLADLDQLDPQRVEPILMIARSGLGQ